MSVGLAVNNPEAQQDSATGHWHHTADLVAPGGLALHLDVTIDNTAHQFWKALVASTIVPAEWITPAGPVVDADVTHLLGVIAIGQQVHDTAPAPTVTTYTGPNLSL